MSSLWTVWRACPPTIQTAYGPSFNNEGAMPTERLSMRKIRDVLRLKFENGLSERVIARSLSLSNGAVNGYLQRARMAGLGLAVARRSRRRGTGAVAVSAGAAVAAPARPTPDWPIVDKELRRTGVTLALLWEEYRAAHPDGFGYSWFCEHYAAFKRRAASDHAPEPRRRREGVRRFRRRHDRCHRSR